MRRITATLLKRQKAEAIEGIIKAMDDAGVTLDDLLDHCERQGKIVRRMKTTFRERRLSSGLEMMVREKDDGASGAFSERMKKLWGDAGAFRHIVNGEPDVRYKPIDGMYMVVKPVVEEVKIHDGPVLSDALFKYGAYFKFHITCFLTCILFGWSLIVSPIVWMDITATDKIFFNSTNSTEAGTPGLKTFSQVVFTIYLVAFSVIFTNNLLMLNRSMRQFQWNNMKWTIMATLGINGVYTIAAGTMLPHATHLLYLYVRLVALAVIVYFDSVLAYAKLRLTPELFAKRYGGSGKKGLFSTIFALIGILSLLTDFWRHSLIIYETPVASVLSLNIRNPVTGNILGFTNEMVMTSTYYTGMLFAAKAIKSMSNTSQLQNGIQKFIITNK